ncbi:MAG: hypothetical protein H7X94_15225 [Vallitaleaceae bacterium]|nr:hypothetical protein [Vallitaleaceae bacterium]
MPDFIQKITEQITSFWNKFTTKSKIQIIVAVVISIIALVILTLVLNRPTLVKYASGIKPDKMNEIVTVLEDNEIAYEVRDNATALYVDSKKKQQVTLLTEQIGILSDAEMTWEEALTNSLTTTSSEKQIKFQLAFEEELNKKIETLDAISKAYVKLDVAQEDTTIFDENKKSSATVILETSQELNEDQVAGVVSFLKNAVNNLEEGNISIMTTDGKLLYDGTSESSLSGSISNKLDYEFAREQDTEAKLRSVLLARGEYDDATVSADLTIDFDEISTVSEDFTGLNGTSKGAILEESTSETTGTNTDASGTPGTDSNATDTLIQTPGSSDSSSSSKDTTYQPSKTIISKTDNVGDIEYTNSTVSVILNKFVYYDEALLEKQGALDSVTWGEFQAQNGTRTKLTVDPEIVSLIKTTAKIENVAVMGYNVPMFVDKVVTPSPILNYVPVVIIVLLIGLLGYAVYKGTAPVEITEVEPELSVEELLASTKSKHDLEIIEFDGKSDTRVQIEKFVTENPEAVALLLRNWLSEDWE